MPQMPILSPDHAVMKLNKKEALLLQDAINHYMQYQLGINTWQALEYEGILKKIEGTELC